VIHFTPLVGYERPETAKKEQGHELVSQQNQEKIQQFEVATEAHGCGICAGLRTSVRTRYVSATFGVLARCLG